MSLGLIKFPKLKVLLVPKQKRKFCLSLNNLAFIFKDIFLLNPQFGKEYKSVVKLSLNMFPI